MLTLKIQRFIYIIFAFITASCSAFTSDSGIKYATYIRRSPINIYIDETMDVNKKTMVYEALKAWEKASNHAIYFNISVKRRPPKYLNIYEPKDEYGIFFWYLDPNDKEYVVDATTMKRFNRLNGLYIPSRTIDAANVIVFKSPNIENSDALFYSTALHELGHLLGLRHMDEFNTIMYKYSNYRICITQLDANKLCEIYKCDPKPECIVQTSP